MSLGKKDLIQVENNKIKKAFRRSIVANKDIDKGKKITKEDLTFKRPGDGLEPRFLKRLIGRRTKRNIYFDQQLTLDDLN